MDLLTNLLLWFSAISVGLMAGVYFTFSAFVMRSLDAIEAPAGMLAMQSRQPDHCQILLLANLLCQHTILRCADRAGGAGSGGTRGELDADRGRNLCHRHVCCDRCR